jgi:hypothetical protein
MKSGLRRADDDEIVLPFRITLMGFHQSTRGRHRHADGRRGFAPERQLLWPAGPDERRAVCSRCRPVRADAIVAPVASRLTDDLSYASPSGMAIGPRVAGLALVVLALTACIASCRQLGCSPSFHT